MCLHPWLSFFFASTICAPRFSPPPLRAPVGLQCFDSLLAKKYVTDELKQLHAVVTLLQSMNHGKHITKEDIAAFETLVPLRDTEINSREYYAHIELQIHVRFPFA